MCIRDRWCPVYDVHMGVHGGKVPADHGVTREEVDLWSLRSHRHSIRAMDCLLYTSLDLNVMVANFEKNIIKSAYEKYGSSRKAAKAIGISQTQLIRKKNKYQI